MALPTLQRKLFENDGYGPNIKDERLSTDITVKDWDASHDYSAGVLAKAGGDIYKSVAASGPGTAAGAGDPASDSGSYWIQLVSAADVSSIVSGLGYAVDSNVVHKTGAETINGKKTFTTDIYVQRENPYLKLVETDVTHHTSAAQSGYQGLYFYDKDEIPAGKVVAGLYSAGSADLILGCTRNISSDIYAEYAVELACQPTRTFFMPRGTNGVIELGGGSNRWKQVYAASSTISTSDERKKTLISFIPDNVLDAWGTINFVQFKFKDAVQEKGADSRIHSGLIAQRIDDAFKAFNLDAARYGLFCHDSWEAEAEERDAEGNLMRNAREAGDEYSLRYEEALCMEAAYQRRRADRAEARISALEARLATLEAKLNG